MTSLNDSCSLTSTSNIDRVTDRGSTKLMVEFDCGSRSISSVLKLLLATAAARLMAVVVLPTPPFWLATVMIIRTEIILQDWESAGRKFQISNFKLKMKNEARGRVRSPHFN